MIHFVTQYQLLLSNNKNTVIFSMNAISTTYLSETKDLQDPWSNIQTNSHHASDQKWCLSIFFFKLYIFMSLNFCDIEDPMIPKLFLIFWLSKQGLQPPIELVWPFLFQLALLDLILSFAFVWKCKSNIYLAIVRVRYTCFCQHSSLHSQWWYLQIPSKKSQGRARAHHQHQQ